VISTVKISTPEELFQKHWKIQKKNLQSVLLWWLCFCLLFVAQRFSKLSRVFECHDEADYWNGPRQDADHTMAATQQNMNLWKFRLWKWGCICWLWVLSESIVNIYGFLMSKVCTNWRWSADVLFKGQKGWMQMSIKLLNVNFLMALSMHLLSYILLYKFIDCILDTGCLFNSLWVCPSL